MKGKNNGTAGVSVRLRFRPSAAAGKPGRLCYQLVIRRRSHCYSSAYRIYAQEWDGREGVTDGGAEARRAAELGEIRRRARWEAQRMADIARGMASASGMPAYGDIVREFERQRAEQSFRSFVQAQAARLRKAGRARTAETYQSAFNSLMRFLGKDDIFLYEFDSALIEDYEAHLRSGGLTPNSTSFYMRVLRAVLNKAAAQGLAAPGGFFRNVYTGIGATAKRAVGIEDLKRIMRLDLASDRRLDFARDMFLLSLCFRGMSFVDMAGLRRGDLRNGRLSYRRRKTGQLLEIKWEPKMSRILEKYPSGGEYLLPVLKSPGGESRKRFKNASKQLNRWLRKVGEMAGIKTPLTMYVARHTWASVAKQKNIPIGVISDALGHASERTTQIYLSALDTSAVDNANRQILDEL